MWKKSKITDQTASGQGPEQGKPRKRKVSIKKRSKVPGVMVTQYVEELPEGKSTPDFSRKPIALTIQEGKFAMFKAVVTGDPKPEVTWRRAKGELEDREKFLNKFDEKSGEYTLEISKVCGEDADTYKCFAVNEYGKAVCTATLNVIEVGFKKKKATEEAYTADPAEFRKMLRKRAEKPEEKEEGGIDEKFWEVLLSSDKKEYERLCAEYGIKDFRWMLKKLNEMKKEREEEQAKYIDYLSNLRHIEVKGDGTASFELDLVLKDPTSRIFLYKDGVMIPFSEDMEMKHNLKQVGKKLIFSVRDLSPEDAGIYQVDVEEVNVFSTEFKISSVDFIVKIQEVRAKEREDALFECVLSHPMPKIMWMGRNAVLEAGEKYKITVSEDKLIHRLVVTDCLQLDKGIYAAVAGIKTCSAWLVVEADHDPSTHGKKKVRKTTQAGGAGVSLETVALEQQVKLQNERKEMLDSARELKEEKNTAAMPTDTSGDGKVGGPPEEAGLGSQLASESRTGPRSLKELGTDLQLEDGFNRAGSESSTVLPVDTNLKTAVSDGAVTEGAGSCGSDSDSGSGIIPPVSEPVPVVSKGLDGRDDGEKKIPIRKLENEDEMEHKEKDTSVPRSGQTNNQGAATNLQEKPSLADSEEADATDDLSKHIGRKRQGPLLVETVTDPSVHFTSGLSDVNVILGKPTELSCKLSSDDCEGSWYKDGKQLSSADGLIIEKDGASHRLKIRSCLEDHAGKYRFEADGRKTEATIIVEDPPRFDPDSLEQFSKPIVVRAGQNATFKIPFSARDPIKVQWYREGEELLDGTNIKLEKTPNQSRLLLSKCQRKDTGEIKIKVKNESGTIEAFTQLIVLDKPSPPQGPVEVVESSASCIEIKWRPPKDDGGTAVKGYALERQQVGRNTWKKLGEISDSPRYRDIDVDHGRKYCYRIRAVTEEGTSEVMETEEVMAGTKAYPGSPAPPKVVSASKDCIHLSWAPPTNTGGSRILGYMLEKRKKGSNMWSPVNPSDRPVEERKYAVGDLITGMEYEFRVAAINVSGTGEPSVSSEFVFARDPKKRPGRVTDLKVSGSTFTTLSLSWNKPSDEVGVQDEAQGYVVEVRPAESQEWIRCNANPVTMTSYTIKGLKAMAMYWVRVIATNEGGEGEPQELDNYILAMPPPVRPQFKDSNMKSFMVVKAGNSIRININFEASPGPDVIWLKDNTPVSKRVTITNADGSSQLLIPSSERSDTGVYTIIVKNLVGQETFSIEIRVTDDPKPPGPVELEENVPGTVTVMWEPSPDEKRDNRLHYTVAQRDSSKKTWHTVADRLFNNKFTSCNIMPGREYHFRVYAKNDMGLSEPSESPTWGTSRKRDKLVVKTPVYRPCDLQSPPAFLVPLKEHMAPQGYGCYMSCAVGGNPAPRVTWLRENVSINANANYYITNTCGVCSMLILRVGPKDTGEYVVTAENALGRAQCSTRLTIRE